MITTIKNKYLTVSADSHGAELCKITDKDGNDWLWTGSEPYWKSHATVIFPICGRLNGGKYTYQGNTYELGGHGFAKLSDFECEQDGNTITYTLKSNDETKKVYPFDFTLTMKYELFDDTIVCTESVKNDGKDDLIFTMGGHPGFCVPLEDGKKFTDYYVEFSKSSADLVVLSDAKMATDLREKYDFEDGKLYLKHNLFDRDALFFDNKLVRLTLKSDNGKKEASVTCPQARAWGLWHNPETEAPFVCIEPWLGLPSVDGVEDKLETKPRMEKLKTGDTFDFAYSITFSER